MIWNGYQRPNRRCLIQMNQNDYTEAEIKRYRDFLELVVGPETLALWDEDEQARQESPSQQQDRERNQ